MVLNLFRLSKYLRSNWPVVTCDFFCAQNPLGRLVELASEHSRLLAIFVIKKYGSRSKSLKFGCSDMPAWLRYKPRLSSIFSSRMIQQHSWQFLKVRAFFSMNIFFPINYHAPCKSCIKFPKFWGVCRVHTLNSSLALKISTTLSLIREESP